uniref:Small ribosomal subunit protein mS40 n=1 Tax=Ixodes ricinus TaxID=34613 RepID=A0A0K8RGA1_IXORI
MAALMWFTRFSRRIGPFCSIFRNVPENAQNTCKSDERTFSAYSYRFPAQPNVIPANRYVSTSTANCCKVEPEATADSEAANGDAEVEETSEPLKRKKVTLHPPETSILYLESKAYKDTYGNDPVWTNYRRNFKGQFPPPKTRATCIRAGQIFTGNPCPICRDEYLVVHHTNVKLLQQFISPYTGEIMKPIKTGVCRKKQYELDLEILKAKDLGLLKYQVPFRHYNYGDYYPQLRRVKKGAEPESQEVVL